MHIKNSGIRRDYTLDYEFEGEIITATYTDNEQTITDTFDLSDMPDGAKITDIESEIPVSVIKKAERIDGELRVEIFKPYGNLQKINKYYNKDWQGMINSYNEKIEQTNNEIANEVDEQKIIILKERIVNYEIRIDEIENERNELKDYCNKFNGFPNEDWQVV